MPHTPLARTINLQEVSTRARTARNIITGFSLATPALADRWRQVDDALSDIPALRTEITGLRTRLAACRFDRANLAAAGKATIAAHSHGEPDPLSYLLDELDAQGYTSAGRRA